MCLIFFCAPFSSLPPLSPMPPFPSFQYTISGIWLGNSGPNFKFIRGMGERGGREEKGAQKKMRHMQKGEYNIWSQKDLMDAYYVKNILYSQCPPIKMVNSKHLSD
jgi:hypothetical protein